LPIQALEREKMDLKAKLDSTSSVLTKYREEKSVGMKDKYMKEMKDFIDGLQLKDPEIKNSMHAKMEVRLCTLWGLLAESFWGLVAQYRADSRRSRTRATRPASGTSWRARRATTRPASTRSRPSPWSSTRTGRRRGSSRGGFSR
jgi:hypothetical protein